MRVAIIDDHVAVAQGLSLLLNDADDIEVVGVAADLTSGLATITDAQPDVVVMDFNLPDGDGIQGTVELLERHPEVHVVIFSSSANAALLAKAIEAGCAGIVSKTQSGGEVVAAIRAAYRGESVIPSSMLASLVTHLSSPPSSGVGALSSRELEILQWLANGTPTGRIATELYLSEHTVRNHIRNILTKLGAHSRLEAVAIAARDGLIDLSATSPA